MNLKNWRKNVKKTYSIIFITTFLLVSGLVFLIYKHNVSGSEPSTPGNKLLHFEIKSGNAQNSAYILDRLYEERITQIWSCKNNRCLW